MANCAVEGRVASRLPDEALAYHGNLAEQQRTVGPVRGLWVATKNASSSIAALAEKSGCMSCHAPSARVVGPSLAEVAQKYRTDNGAEARLFAKVRDGGKGAWGEVPMPPHPQLAEAEIRSLVRWFLTSN